jgi:hypothetical protein
MKQVIILLATVILGIAIPIMVMSFRGTTQTITTATQNQMESKLVFIEKE